MNLVQPICNYPREEEVNVNNLASKPTGIELEPNKPEPAPGREYVPPKLRRLGSVVELTLSGGATSTDALFTRKLST